MMPASREESHLCPLLRSERFWFIYLFIYLLFTLDGCCKHGAVCLLSKHESTRLDKKDESNTGERGD